jgi:hypothetical protein
MWVCRWNGKRDTTGYKVGELLREKTLDRTSKNQWLQQLLGANHGRRQKVELDGINCRHGS